jgi:putative transposase
MGNKHRIHRAGRDRAVAELLDLRAQGVPLDGTLFEIAAEGCGYSVRQIRRVVAAALREAERRAAAGEYGSRSLVHPVDETPSAWTVDEETVLEVFICCGNLQNAYGRLKRAGKRLPSLSTFKRKVNAHVGAYGMEVARKGEGKARQRRIYLKRAPEDRGHTYETDHTEAPVWVIPDGHLRARRPGLTGVIDRGTGYLLSLVITFGTPTAEEIRVAFISAIHTRVASDGQTLIGGLPTRIVWDQGKDFLSDLVTVSCLRLGTMPCPLPSYSPNLKPRIERFWRFIKENLFATLAGYIDSGADVRGNLARAQHALSQAAFVEIVTDWVEWYNTEHVNRETKLTALQQWKSDPRDIVSVPDDQLWQDFLLFDDDPIVSSKGVVFKGITYVTLGNELADLGGRQVQVRYLPHHRGFIEIFHDGKHIGTGLPSDQLTPENRPEFLRQRSADEARIRKNITAVQRLQRDDPNTAKIHRKKRGGRSSYVVATDGNDLRVGQQEALDSYKPPPRTDGFDANGQGGLW